MSNWTYKHCPLYQPKTDLELSTMIFPGISAVFCVDNVKTLIISDKSEKNIKSNVKYMHERLTNFK